MHVRMRLHEAEPAAGHAAAALGVAEAGRARSLLEVLADGRDARSDDPRARPLDADAIGRALDEDTLLLEYALGDVASYLWVVSRDGLRAYTLPPRAAIQAAVRPVRERLATPPGTDGGRADGARRLSAVLLGPAADQLGGKRLLVAAADILQYVPFAALPDPRSRDDAPLLARNEVVQTPSASTAAAIRHASARRTGVSRGHRGRPGRPRLRAAGSAPRGGRSGARPPRRRSGPPRRCAGRRSRGCPSPGSRRTPSHARPARDSAHRALGFDATRAAVLGPTCRTTAHRPLRHARRRRQRASRPARASCSRCSTGRGAPRTAS